jgi:transcriptional regulator with XRE-family HTH domain
MIEVTLSPQQVNKIVFKALDNPTSIMFRNAVIETALTGYMVTEENMARLNRALARVGFKIQSTSVSDKSGAVSDKPAVVKRKAKTYDTQSTETLGDRIKRLRKSMKMSQAELAKAAGLVDIGGQAMVSKWERNAQTPGTTSLQLLAAAFKVDVSELTQTTDTKKKRRGFLGRDHEVFDTKPSRFRRAPSFSRDDEDDEPAERKVKRYAPVIETGPKVLEIIQYRSITAQTLCNEFEVTHEEYGRIREQHWSDFGARWMHELLQDLKKIYATPDDNKVAKPDPQFHVNHMTRNQIVTELRELFAANPWLTCEELVNNFEFGQEDYEYIMANEPNMISKAVLVDYLNDIRGGIAEHAIEVPN